MKGRIALVTGGTRGIGAAIAIELKKSGYTVGVTYQENEESAERFRRTHQIEIFRWDVGDYEACHQGIQWVQQRLGVVDILVNNAGITRDVMFHKAVPEDWNAVIHTNLISCFNMSRVVIGGMREQNFGRIINISSINAQRGQAGQTNYCAAKAGILGFTKALALETTSKGVTVNAICPGYINTDMVQTVPQETMSKIIQQIPLRRLGEAREVARGVLFLASDEAGFVTGSTLSLNGGHYMI